MKLRRFIYLAAILVVVVLLSRGYKGYDRTEITFPGNPISKEDVLKDMQDLSDNRLPVQPVLGGHFFVTRISFKQPFSGEKGSMFWVAIEDGHVSYVLAYTVSEEPDRELAYKVTDIKEGSQVPVDGTEVWEPDGKGGFVKAKAGQ